MQASSCTAIAGCEVGPGAAVAREAARRRPPPCRPSSRTANRGRAPSRAPAGRRPAARTPACAMPWRARSRCRPSCPAAACGCTRRRARARPRSRPCRRGNCRRGDSPAPAIAEVRDLDAAAIGDLPDASRRGGASTSSPSRMNLMRRVIARFRRVIALLGEMLQDQLDGVHAPPGPGRRSRRRASPRELAEERLVPLGALHQLDRLLGADAAGRALAAALVLEEAAAG